MMTATGHYRFSPSVLGNNQSPPSRRCWGYSWDGDLLQSFFAGADIQAQYTQTTGSNFNEIAVFEEVMSKLKKWEVPTEFYKYKWTPILSEKFNATYIGGQGTNLFLLTFPMMLISVLGCIYIHIKNKKELPEKSFTSKKHLASLRRPLLVLGPLGVVTTMELIFAIMGFALMSWQFGNYYFVAVKHPLYESYG